MTKYPFPTGQLLDAQYNKDGIVKIECTSFLVENLGDAPVTLLGRTLETGDSFTVPFAGLVYKLDMRIQFTGVATKNLYILQSTSEACNS